jgi:hypothetical protein
MVLVRGKKGSLTVVSRLLIYTVSTVKLFILL